MGIRLSSYAAKIHSQTSHPKTVMKSASEGSAGSTKQAPRIIPSLGNMRANVTETAADVVVFLFKS